MKTLVIAEKPSMARAIQVALGNKDMLYTSAFGHLYGLKDVVKYKGLGKEDIYHLGTYPFVPDQWDVEPIKKDGIKARIKEIKELLAKCDRVVHAGDADREGELIVRVILQELKNKKPVYRLWLNDLEPSTIKKAYQNMKPIKETDDLYKSGLIRWYTDWLYGINYTQLLYLTSDTWAQVGRVMTAFVQAICERRKEIDEFVPEEYFKVKNGVFTSTKEFGVGKKADAEKWAKALSDTRPYQLVSSKKEERVVKRPKLFSMSTLQNEMNRVYKWNASKTLAETQKLYTGGWVTYPRTDTEYMQPAEKGFAQDVCDMLNKECGKNLFEVKDNDYIFDAKRASAHSAITPTRKPYKVDDNPLYNTIVERFKEHFYKIDTIVEADKQVWKAGKLEQWEIVNERVIQEGYKKPQLRSFDKDQIQNAFEVEACMTEPPKLYTVSTFNNMCKNPFKNDDEYEAIAKGIELGTEATRAGIIDKIIKLGYITFSKNAYDITDKGKRYVKLVADYNVPINIESTAKLQGIVKGVETGKVKYEEAYNHLVKSIKEQGNQMKSGASPRPRNYTKGYSVNKNYGTNKGYGAYKKNTVKK